MSAKLVKIGQKEIIVSTVAQEAMGMQQLLTVVLLANVTDTEIKILGFAILEQDTVSAKITQMV